MCVLQVLEVSRADPGAVALRAAQRVEIKERYGHPDSEPGPAPTGDDIAAFFVALDDGRPVACRGLRQIDDTSGEIKRMFVAPATRGTGASTAVLTALETRARDAGWTVLKLETGDRQPDAVAFYTRQGYRPIEKFGHYVGSETSRCFARTL